MGIYLGTTMQYLVKNISVPNSNLFEKSFSMCSDM